VSSLWRNEAHPCQWGLLGTVVVGQSVQLRHTGTGGTVYLLMHQTKQLATVCRPQWGMLERSGQRFHDVQLFARFRPGETVHFQMDCSHKLWCLGCGLGEASLH